MLERIKILVKRYEVKHREIIVNGESIYDCLRSLEKKAGLPRSDLEMYGEPSREVSLGAMRMVLSYPIKSKRSDNWKSQGKVGYISGRVIEGKESVLTPDKMLNLPMSMVNASTEPIIIGELFITENCPGVFDNGVCTTCGYKFS